MQIYIYIYIGALPSNLKKQWTRLFLLCFMQTISNKISRHYSLPKIGVNVSFSFIALHVYHLVSTNSMHHINCFLPHSLFFHILTSIISTLSFHFSTNGVFICCLLFYRICVSMYICMCLHSCSSKYFISNRYI